VLVLIVGGCTAAGIVIGNRVRPRPDANAEPVA
jgi:hypothetical protein